MKSNYAVGTVSGNFVINYSTNQIYQRLRKNSTSSNCKVWYNRNT